VVNINLRQKEVDEQATDASATSAFFFKNTSSTFLTLVLKIVSKVMLKLVDIKIDF